jgi:proton-coupled amino acid transporter
MIADNKLAVPLLVNHAGSLNNHFHPSYGSSDRAVPLASDDPDDRKRATLFGAALNFMKANIASGVLFLPKAYQQGGLVLSNVAMVVIFAMSLYCIALLVEVREGVPHDQAVTFGSLAEMTLGKRGRWAVDISLVLSQSGFCCVYFAFVGANVAESLAILTNCRVQVPERSLIVAQGFVYVLLSWVRRINSFEISSLISGVLIIAGLCYIVVVSTAAAGTRRNHHVVVRDFNWPQFPIFLGTAVYSFEVLLFVAQTTWDNAIIDVGRRRLCSHL